MLVNSTKKINVCDKFSYSGLEVIMIAHCLLIWDTCQLITNNTVNKVADRPGVNDGYCQGVSIEFRVRELWHVPQGL